MKYYEDFELGSIITVGTHVVKKDEIVEFATKWDPQPFHVDEEAAVYSEFRGLIACGCHIVSIAIRLLDSQETKAKVLAGMGWDEVRFSHPVRPGDELTVSVKCLGKRDSKTRPSAGIVRTAVVLKNQREEPVLTFQDNLLVAKRRLE
jgi:acyl dehydratase